MAWEGYLELGGNEILNSSRVAAYVRNRMPQFMLRDCAECDSLITALEDPPYSSPARDDAPWFDASDPASADFYGIYPLAITGLDDSTRSATVTEGVLSGGSVGRTREGTRSVRVRALMVARDRLSMESGMRWLSAALSPGDCSMHGASCGTADMCFYAACPEVEVECYDDFAFAGDLFELGEATPELSPIIYTFTRVDGPLQPQSVTWGLEPFDADWPVPFNADPGTVIRYGVMEEDSPEVVEQSGLIALYRVNRVRNPSFAANTATWEAEANGTTITRVATGGVEDGAYLLVENTLPDEPTVSISEGTLGGFTGSATLSFSARASGASGSLTVTIEPDGGGSAIATQSFPVEDEWARYSIQIPASPDLHVTFSADVAEFDLDQVLFEDGLLLLPYFDGSTAAEEEYAYSWQGTPNASRSQSVWTGVANTRRNNSLWRPFLEVVQGRIPMLTMNRGYFRQVPIDEQLRAYNRKLHDVACVSGPLVIRDYHPSVGYLREVDFVLVAEKPWVYSDPAIIYRSQTWFGTPWVDNVINLIPNPRVAESEDGWGFVGQDPSEMSLEETGGPLPSAPTFLRAEMVATPNPLIRVSPAAADTNFIPVSPGAPYVFSIYSRSSVDRPMRMAVQFYDDSLDPVGGLVYGEAFQSGEDTWQREFLEAPLPDGATLAQPFVEIYLSEVGDVIDFTAAMLTRGDEVYDYFDGSTPSSAAWQYEWSGEENDSPSIRSPFVATVDPLVDPDCGPIPTPPRPPVIPDVCVEEINEWDRLRVEIPRENVSAWSSTVPTLTLVTTDEAVRQVRVRFFPNPFGYPMAVLDPSSWCAEFIVSYIPPNTEFVVDATIERALASVSAGPYQAADHLLYGTGGNPISWADMSCGIPYVMTVDVPPGEGQNLGVNLDVTRRA